MKNVVTQPMRPFRTTSGRIEVHQIPSWNDNLIWLLVDPASGDAAAIDGPQATEVLAYCREHGYRLTTIMNTHTHPDHIGINTDLASQNLLDGIRVIGSRLRKADVPGITECVDDHDAVYFAGVRGQVLLTEGHIDGHISFLFEDAIFCGDTLFTGGCGYLFDGPPETMWRSLSRLAALDPDTRVCCAHEYTQDNLRFAWFVEPGNRRLAQRIADVWDKRAQGASVVPSTIELERETNPFLRTQSLEIIERLRVLNPAFVSDEPSAVFAATRALKDLKTYREIKDADLPLSS